MSQTDYASTYLPNLAYTEADVEANREGLLTEDQFYLVETVYQTRQQMARQTYRLFAIWIPLLVIIGFVVEYQQSGKSLGEFIPTALPILLLVGGSLFLLLVIARAFTNFSARDARDKRVSVAEGEAQVIEKEVRSKSTTSMHYELRLNGRSFRFANHASIAHFEDGQQYRVYYIKYYPFPLMLSAEQL